MVIKMIKVIIGLTYVTKEQLMVIFRERWYANEKNKNCLGFPEKE